MYTILLVIHTIIVLFLILMILFQRSDSDGMGGLGGGGGNQFMTGRSAANLMTRTTAILAAAFMISSLVLAIYAGHMTNSSIVDSVPEADAIKVIPVNPNELLKDKAPADSKEGSDVAQKTVKPAVKAAPSVPKPD